MHVSEDAVNNHTFARYLSEGAGYKVGMFGKYLNNVPNFVPLGFDAWMANGGGDYIAPSFATARVPGFPDGHWHGNVTDYSTSGAQTQTEDKPVVTAADKYLGVWLGAVIGNKSIEWIREKAQAGGPWLAYIAPKACHEPFNPAPWYVDFWDPACPTHEPRTPNWNTSGADHHGAPGGQHPPLSLNSPAALAGLGCVFRRVVCCAAANAPLTADAGVVVTDIFKNRW